MRIAVLGAGMGEGALAALSRAASLGGDISAARAAEMPLPLGPALRGALHGAAFIVKIVH